MLLLQQWVDDEAACDFANLLIPSLINAVESLSMTSSTLSASSSIKMEEVIVALLYLFAISLARDYLEKRFDRILSLLEDDMNASEIPPGRSNSICSDSSSCDSDEEEEDDDLYEIIDEQRYVL